MALETRLPIHLAGGLPHLRDMVQETANGMFPVVPYRLLKSNTEHAEYDSLYDEVPEYAKSWDTAVALRAFFQPAEQFQPLSIFGIEINREMTLYADVLSMEAVGLLTLQEDSTYPVLLCQAGDRFIYSREVVYEVLEWKIGSAWGNTDVPLWYYATAERARAESDAGTMYPRDDAGWAI